jgi:hypothetical protein
VSKFDIWPPTTRVPAPDRRESVALLRVIAVPSALMADEPSTEELRVEQLKREVAERQAADSAPADEEEAQHERRAEKAAYLREKLAEREESEREAEQD